MYALYGVLAGACSIAAYLRYITAIYRNSTRPNRATWFIWTIVSCILLASYAATGARTTLWVPISYAVGSLAIFLLSLWRGEGGWTRFDRTCLSGVVLSLFLWWYFRTPIVALLMNLSIDLMGALPTIRKSWLQPEGEDRYAWLLWAAGNTLNLLAVKSWTFANAAYTVYMFLGAGLICVLVWRPALRRSLQ